MCYASQAVLLFWPFRTTCSLLDAYDDVYAYDDVQRIADAQQSPVRMSLCFHACHASCALHAHFATDMGYKVRFKVTSVFGIMLCRLCAKTMSR